MHKIRKLSCFLLVLFQILFILQPIALIAFWISPNFWLHGFGYVSFIPRSIEILHPLTSSDAFYGFLIDFPSTALAMAIVYCLIKLFKLYAKGEIFSLSNVKYIWDIGILMLVEQVFSFFHEVLMGLVLTWHNPVGHRMTSISFDNYNVHYIITAIMIILVSWIMQEGVKLQEEQKYTV